MLKYLEAEYTNNKLVLFQWRDTHEILVTISATDVYIYTYTNTYTYW